MITFPETFLETPLGALRVWATGDPDVCAATLHDHEKRSFQYRDNSDAQRCAEHVTINRVAYTIFVHLRPVSAFHEKQRLDERLHQEHAGWGINWYGVTLHRADNFDGPSDAAKRKAEGILLPALATFANSPAGRRLLDLAAIAQRRERLANLEQEIATRVDELECLRATLAELQGVERINRATASESER